MTSLLITHKWHQAAALALALTLPAKAADALLASQLSVATASLADVASSWGRQEANPLLGRGTFGARQFVEKEALTGVALSLQRPLLRRWPRLRREFVVLNWVTVGLLTGGAVYNWGSR